MSVHKHHITAAWLRERIVTCLHGDSAGRSIAHRELAEGLWPIILQIAGSHQQKSEVLAGCGPQVAEDAAVHAYIRFLENLGDHETREQVMGWFHMVIRNFMIAEARYYTTYQLTDDHAHLDQTVYVTASILTLRDFLFSRLRMLGYDHLHVMFFRYWENHLQIAIADHWGITHQHISQLERVSLGKLKTAMSLEGYLNDGEADTTL